MDRRLAAILAADMVGYSRLMAVDETGTIRRQKAHRAALIDPKIAEHGGRIVKTTGDGMLVEFPSAVGAVTCAIEIQRSMILREASVPDDKRIVYRIGINLGDIVIDGDDILGDGVNIAARLEGLSEPGGIYLSQSVHTQVDGKIDFHFESLGARQVKNIPRPIEVFRVLLDGRSTGSGSAAPSSWRRLLGGFGFGSDNAPTIDAEPVPATMPQPPEVEPARTSPRHDKAHPDKRSIAVLPFDNLSGDKDEEYFSDGIADDLITDLSKISGLYVVSRHASFRFKNSDSSPEEIARELNVEIVLRGSIRRMAGKIRLNVQLIDTSTDFQLWGERYDWSRETLFEGQDALREQIIAALDVRLTDREAEQVMHRGTENFEAYDLYLRALYYYELYTESSNAQTRQLLLRVIETDPMFDDAHMLLSRAYTYVWDAQLRGVPDALSRSVESVQRAIEINPKSSQAFRQLGWARLWQQRHDDAITAGRKAVTLDPNSSLARAMLGEILNFSGLPEEGLQMVTEAIRMDPHHAFVYKYILAHAHDLLGDRDQAVTLIKDVLADNYDFLPAHRHLAVIYSETGLQSEAEAAAAEILRISPSHTVSRWRERDRYKDPAARERFANGLRKAGLPE